MIAIPFKSYAPFKKKVDSFMNCKYMYVKNKMADIWTTFHWKLYVLLHVCSAWYILSACIFGEYLLAVPTF